MLSLLTVTNNADSGLGSLRDAIVTANTNGDATNTVNFAPGLAGGTITLTSGELAITKSLNIEGPGKNPLTVERSFAQGTPSFRIFDITGSAVDVTIAGLKIANGLADGTLAPALNPGLGGGIYHAGGVLKLFQVVLSGNQARGDSNISPLGLPGLGAGGGIANVSGPLEVTDSILTHNMAQGGDGGIGGPNNPAGSGRGGGIINLAIATVIHSAFTGNMAQGGVGNGGFSPGTAFGGGIENAPAAGGALTILRSTFDHDESIGGNGGNGPICGNATGGGIHNGVGAVATILRSAFTHDQAIGGSNGSGLFFPGSALGGGLNSQGVVTIAHSTFVQNQAVGGSFTTGSNAGVAIGGGLFNDLPATLTIIQSTFDGNRAIGGSSSSTGPGLGGGLGNQGAASVTRGKFTHNQANGGSLNSGTGAGVGFGGGLFNGFNNAPARLVLTGCLVTANQANGGTSNTGTNAGVGSGGGVYNLAVLEAHASVIKKNHASTSNPNIFP
jgi:hypothetical protein